MLFIVYRYSHCIPSHYKHSSFIMWWNCNTVLHCWWYLRFDLLLKKKGLTTSITPCMHAHIPSLSHMCTYMQPLPRQYDVDHYYGHVRRLLNKLVKSYTWYDWSSIFLIGNYQVNQQTNCIKHYTRGIHVKSEYACKIENLYINVQILNILYKYCRYSLLYWLAC